MVHRNVHAFKSAIQNLEDAENSANNRREWRGLAEGRAQLGIALVAATKGNGIKQEVVQSHLKSASEQLEKAASEGTLSAEKRAHALMAHGYCLQQLGQHNSAASSIATSLEVDGHHRNRFHL